MSVDAYPPWYLYEDTDLKATGNRIVQEGRQRLACDRVTLLQMSGATWRAIQVSGVTQIHRHATALRTIQSAAKCLVDEQAPFLYPSPNLLSPQENVAIDAMLDATNAIAFSFVPLVVNSHEKNRRVGALLFERFAGESFASQRDQLVQFSNSAAVAWNNAREVGSLPGLSFLRWIRWLLSPLRLWKTAAISLALTATIASLFLLKAEQTLEVEGDLQPKTARHVFAPHEGTVAEIFVSHGEKVQVGDKILRLENGELERLERQTSGELRTSQQQLVAIRAQKIAASTSRDTRPNSYDPQLTEQLQLESNIQNLEAQLKLIHDQSNQLEMTSPIAGIVTTWDVTNRLNQRPVSRGDLLVSIHANHADNWKLVLKIPESKLGPILEAEQTNHPLPISFVLGIDPDEVKHAQLESLSTATQIDDSHGIIVLANANVNTQLMSDAIQTGTSVRAKLHCGRKSLAEAWFYELKHWWTQNILFRIR